MLHNLLNISQMFNIYVGSVCLHGGKYLKRFSLQSYRKAFIFLSQNA